MKVASTVTSAVTSASAGTSVSVSDEVATLKPLGGKKHRRVRRKQNDMEEATSTTSGINTLRQFLAAPWTMTIHAVSEKRGPEFGRSQPLQTPEVPAKFEHLGEFLEQSRVAARRKVKGKALEDADAQVLPSLSEHVQAEEEDDPAEDERLFEESVTALHHAALSDDAERVRLLLSGPNERRCLPTPDLSLPNDEFNLTPALKAARIGNAASVAALLDARADPLARDNSHRYFHNGVWPNERRADAIGTATPKDLKDEGALPGRTVVYWLRYMGKFDEVVSRIFPMTRVSLVRSIALGIQEHHGEPALVVAAREGAADLAALLVTHSSAGLPALVVPPYNPSASAGSFFNASSYTKGGFMGASQSAGFSTNMSFAGSTGGMAQFSSTAGFTQKSGGARNGERSQALLVACEARNWRVAMLIVGAGVPASHMSSQRDRLGRTSLHIAAAHGATDVVRALIRCGHPMRLASFRGRQPIHEAAYAGHADAASALLDGRADPLATTTAASGSLQHHEQQLPGIRETGQTAVELAASRGHTAVVAVLSGGLGRSSVASPPSPAGRSGLGTTAPVPRRLPARSASEPFLVR